jgi:uncharacterized protein with von Willebrand factor type A (vWA) domain
MKIDYDANSPIPQASSSELQANPGKPDNRAEESSGDKIIISEEGREALFESMDNVSTATALIEKVASAYPEKDLKLKINDIEIEATESKPTNKLVSLVGSFLGGIVK